MSELSQSKSKQNPIKSLDDNNNNTPEKPKLYWQRWLVFFWFNVAVFVNSIPGEIYVSIASDLQDIYNTSETIMTLASTSYLIMHPLLSIPCSQFIVVYGWATSANVGVVLTILGSALKLLVDDTGFYIVIIGQILIGAGKPFILNAQASIAQCWFYPESRSKILTILNIFNVVSNVVTMLIPGKWIFNNYDEVTDAQNGFSDGHSRFLKLQWVLFYISATTIPCLVFLKKQPPTLPSELVKKEDKSQNMFRILMKLFKNRNFLLCLFAFSLYLGLIKSIVIILPYMFKAFGLGANVVSVAGSCAYVASILSQTSSMILADKVSSKKILISSLMILSTLSIVLLYFCLMTENQYIAYGSISVLGFMFMPIIPLMMDVSCDTIYPQNPSYAIGFMYIGSQFLIVIFSQLLSITIGGSHSSKTRVGYSLGLLVVLQLIGLVAFLFIKLKKYSDIHTETMVAGRSLLDKAFPSSHIKGSSVFNFASSMGFVGLMKSLQQEDPALNQIVEQSELAENQN